MSPGRKTKRVSTSFTLGELEAFTQVARLLEQHPDGGVLLRAPEYQALRLKLSRALKRARVKNPPPAHPCQSFRRALRHLDVE